MQLLKQDVLVLGAGPSGIAAADFAVRQGLEVLMLEGGVREIYPVDAWGKPDDLYPIKAGGIGGQSNVWGAQVVFPEEKLIKHLSRILETDEVWIKELRNHVEDLCIQMNLPIDSSNCYFNDETFFNDKFQTKYSIYLQDTNLSNYFHDSLSNLEIQQDVHVLSLRFDADRVVTVSTSKGSWVVPQDKILIIALGTIETTLLLKRSNLPGAEMIGGGLHDHPSGYLFSFAGQHMKGIRRNPTRKFKNHVLKRKFEYTSERHSRSAIIEFHYILRDENEHGIFPIRIEIQNLIKFYINAFSLRLLGFLPLDVQKIRVWLQIEQEQIEANQIAVIHGGPEITWKLSDTDKDLIYEVYEVLRQHLHSIGIFPTNEFDDWESIFSSFRPALHPSGTIPVVKRASETGLTNFYGVLNCFPNVGIASGALLPCTSWYNPTLLIMAMARNTCKYLIRSKISE